MSLSNGLAAGTDLTGESVRMTRESVGGMSGLGKETSSFSAVKARHRCISTSCYGRNSRLGFVPGGPFALTSNKNLNFRLHREGVANSRRAVHPTP